MLSFSTADLRRIGLSEAKCRAVLSIAESVVDGPMRLSALNRLSDEEVTVELMKLRGVGPWTAQMYLMFSMGRPDVFPFGDLGIANAVTALYKFNNHATETEMIEIAELWRPYRTIASWYLWQALDLVRKDEW